MMNYYDTFENEAELSALERENQKKSIEYMTKPELWDSPTNVEMYSDDYTLVKN